MKGSTERSCIPEAYIEVRPGYSYNEIDCSCTTAEKPVVCERQHQGNMGKPKAVGRQTMMVRNVECGALCIP